MRVEGVTQAIVATEGVPLPPDPEVRRRLVPPEPRLREVQSPWGRNRPALAGGDEPKPTPPGPDRHARLQAAAERKLARETARSPRVDPPAAETAPPTAAARPATPSTPRSPLDDPAVARSRVARAERQVADLEVRLAAARDVLAAARERRAAVLAAAGPQPAEAQAPAPGPDLEPAPAPVAELEVEDECDLTAEDLAELYGPGSIVLCPGPVAAAQERAQRLRTVPDERHPDDPGPSGLTAGDVMAVLGGTRPTPPPPATPHPKPGPESDLVDQVDDEDVPGEEPTEDVLAERTTPDPDPTPVPAGPLPCEVCGVLVSAEFIATTGRARHGWHP